MKTFVLFLPCAVTSGYLYLQTVLSLRRGLQNDNKARLSKLFAMLWISWIFVNVPYLTLEVVMYLPVYTNVVDDDDVDLQWTPHKVQTLMQSFVYFGFSQLNVRLFSI